jgi:predicted nucleic acid-binding protein
MTAYTPDILCRIHILLNKTVDNLEIVLHTIKSEVIDTMESEPPQEETPEELAHAYIEDIITDYYDLVIEMVGKTYTAGHIPTFDNAFVELCTEYPEYTDDEMCKQIYPLVFCIIRMKLYLEIAALGE